MQTLPLDIFHHIVEQISVADHPLSYSRNRTYTQTLLALCLVNRDLNAIATRHLYSSITLATTTAVKSLAKTAEYNPAALRLCRNILFPKSMIDQDSCIIVAAASGLRRLSARGVTNAHRAVVYDRILTELALFRGLGLPLLECGRFRRLQRLAVHDVQFSTTQVVDNLLSLPSLTHLALADPIVTEVFDLENLYHETVAHCLEGLEDYLARKPVTLKVILGLNQSSERPPQPTDPPHLSQTLGTAFRKREPRFRRVRACTP
jgi:hypothetical protein